MLNPSRLCRDKLSPACLALLLVAAVWVMCGGYAPASAQAGSGSAALVPNRASVLDWASIQLVYRVGQSGMVQGGAIRVQFPKSWHPWLPLPAAPQATDPAADHYVTAQASRPGVTVTVGIANVAIDGRTDRMDWTATLSLTGASLAAEDVITYTFGNQCCGGRGFQAPVTALTELVRVAEDTDADGAFVELSSPPTLTIQHAPPYRLVAHLPSLPAPGIPLRLTVAAQDTYTNLAAAYGGTVQFSSTDPLAELPSPYTFSTADGGRQVFTVTLHTTGTHWITVTDNLVAPGGQPSNPVICTEDGSIERLYWGDIHSHTDFSKDGIGPLQSAMLRMRDELGLDFYAATDHIDYPTTGLLPDEWQATRDWVQWYSSPGRFVPILGYEWSLPEPFGHHNIYFDGEDGPLCYLNDCRTLDNLWNRLEGIPALTIPHHTGIRWGTSNTTVDWSYNDPEFRTSIEIFSGHGQSEMYDPAHPLSYEHLGTGTAASVNGPHYARDAWAAGHLIGVVAGSDDHSLRPGRPWNGLTAIYASSLDRASLFAAIRARHTYATTGERILLDFRLGEALMGDVVRMSLSEVPVLDVRVVGTQPLDWVQLVRYDGLSYTTVYTETPGPGGDLRQAEFRFTDPTLSGSGLYYVRVQQPDPNKPEQPAMAWSSPIWVERRVTSYFPMVLRGGASP